MKFKQGKVFVLAFAGAVLANSSAAHAQGYPSRPITLVVPFGVGSGADLMARVLAVPMSETLGQTVVIENVPGAGGMTGVSRVASGPADGYQIAFGGVDTLAINQTLYKKPLYNAATDFAPVGLVTEQPMVLIARKDFPADDMKGFIAHTKANAAKMQYASSGVGSGSHLTCARLNAAMGVDVTHVTYRGSAQAMQDLFAGRIDYYCSLAAAAVSPLESKQAKGIAILTREQSPLFPGLASAHEQGLADAASAKSRVGRVAVIARTVMSAPQEVGWGQRWQAYPACRGPASACVEAPAWAYPSQNFPGATAMNANDRGNYSPLQPVACAEPGATPVVQARGELIVVNKVDAADPVVLQRLMRRERNVVAVSAITGEGIDDLLQAIERNLPGPSVEVHALVPYTRGDLVSRALKDGIEIGRAHV